MRKEPLISWHGWGVFSDRWNYLYPEFYNSRMNFIGAYEKDFNERWASIKRKYQLRAVKVRLELAPPA